MKFTLKIALIHLFLLPSGLGGIALVSLLGLILAYAPLPTVSPAVHQERDAFPQPGWGGVTHQAHAQDGMA